MRLKKKREETLEAVTSGSSFHRSENPPRSVVVAGACNLLKANKFLMLTNVENVSRNLPGKL